MIIFQQKRSPNTSFAFNARHVFLFSAILFLASCSCSNNSPVRDLTVPEVTSTTPGNNSKNAVINTFIDVTFSEEMNASSINSDTFQLFDANGKMISGSLSYSGANATLKPDQTLLKSSDYTVKLSRQLKDLSGNQIVNDYIWQFSTGIKEDDVSPLVSDIFPYEYSSNVALNTNISITFNEAISTSSVNTSSFIVTDITNTNVAGTFTVNDKKITFDPEQDLLANTKYTITLNNGIQDLAGNGLTVEYITQFTTLKPADISPPLVGSVSPMNKAIDVPLNINVAVSFSEAIDPLSVNTSSLQIVDTNSQIISGNIVVNENNVVFEPVLAFSMNQQYSVMLTTDIKDLAGNNLKTAFNWIFTTGTDEDNEAPSVTYINPESNATDVASNNAITATFSEEIDPSTLTSTTMTVVSNAERIDADISYSGNTAIFRPKSILANNTTYTVTLSSNITDQAGNKMSEPYVWTFTTGITPDRDIPSVTSVYPDDGSSSIAVNNAIVARFSEPMDPASINSESFSLTDNNGDQVAGVMKTIGASVTYRPLDTLAFSTNYTVTINTQAADLASNAIKESYIWQFTTSSEEDTIKPTILSTVPASSSNFAPTNRGLIVSFNETMDFETINSSSFYLTDTSGSMIVGNINYAGDTVTFMPNQNLQFSHSYVATLSAGIADMAGNTLGLAHSWSFTTGTVVDAQAPTISNTLPANDALATANTSIIINFDQDMDTVSLHTTNILLRDEANQTISGSVTATANSAIFTPSTNLEYDTRYFVTVTTGVRDLARNHLASEYSWTFKTSLSPDLAPPFVVTVSPGNDQQKVSLTSTLNVLFSEPVNCSTLINANFSLSKNSINIPGTINCTGTTASFTPTEPLATDTLYVALLTTGIIDMQNDALTENFSWQFSTAPWTQQFGSTLTDQGEAITIDASDNIIAAGITSGNLAGLNSGNTDIFITKYSKNSLLVWSRQLGSSSDDYITDIITDSSGNIYLSGYSYGNFEGTNNGSADIIIFKLDSAGTLLWKKQIGTAQDDVATSIQIDNNNDLIVAGYSFAGFDGNLSNGLHDIIVLKLSTAGTKIWSQQLGSTDSDIANDLAIDSSNNIFITGYSQGDFAGTGNTGNADIILAKLDTNSIIQWKKQLGTVLDDRAQAIAIDSSNNIIISGFTSSALNGNTHMGSTDQVVLKYDNTGNLLWSVQTGSDDDDRSYGITIDTNNEVIVSGFTYGDMDGSNAGDFDITLIKLDANGLQQWIKQFGTSSSDLSFAVSHDSQNNLYIIGHSQGEIDGNKNAGLFDAFIMKWNNTGVKQ